MADDRPRLRLRRKSAPGRNDPGMLPIANILDLPVSLLRSILEASSLAELAAYQLVNRQCQQTLRSITREATVPFNVFLLIDNASAGLEVCELCAFRSQSWSPTRPFTISVKLPSSELDVWMDRLTQLCPCRVLGVPRFELTGVAGVSELSELKFLGAQLGQVKHVRLESLEEEDVTRFASLLPSMPLESLQIKDFAIDRPTPSTLSPILGVLPATCVQLDLCYVLPALPALAMLPATVQRIGTLVVMDEIFYYSRKVGMSLSLFAQRLPTVATITEVKLVLGPGHYEEPSWPVDGAHIFVTALRAKLPNLERIRMKVHAESVAAPPLVPILLALHASGIDTQLYLEAQPPLRDVLCSHANMKCTNKVTFLEAF
ncbi:Ctse [Symbiodinium natans]|uniref:Ctse protein n=1 Tax=Symbiodinium natans TaxID=878477 RepID=A0A812M0N6_9DINO|nr:Ctse [Symbiodinium natans]